MFVRVLLLCVLFEVIVCPNPPVISCSRNGLAGVCKPQSSCPELRARLDTLPPSEHNGERYSWRCKQSRKPLVCCPGEPYYEPPVSVDGHRNLNMLPINCGDASTDKLFGAKTTGIAEFPWMALISSRKNSQKRARDFHCAGSIINKRYILTAAHCITKLSGRVLLGVRVGEHDISKPKDCEQVSLTEEQCNAPHQDIAIQRVIPHPGYVGVVPGDSLRLQHDIGLIRLAKDIHFNNNVMPVCLPTTSKLQNTKLEGVNATLSGWGRTNVYPNGSINYAVQGTMGEQSTVLLKIDIPVLSNKDCGRIMNATIADGVGFRQLCAGGEDGISSCNGDSGGPLINPGQRDNTVKIIQVGVVSGGSLNCGDNGSPAIFSRVAHYMTWILDQLEP